MPKLEETSSYKFSFYKMHFSDGNSTVKDVINLFSTSIPFMWKPGSYFLLAKCLKTPLEKCLKTPVQVDELHLYLKCHSSIVDFQIFC